MASQDVVAFQHEHFETRKLEENLQVAVVGVTPRIVQVTAKDAFELVQDDALERRQAVNDFEVTKNWHLAKSSPRIANL